jgi:hypothetical protein
MPELAFELAAELRERTVLQLQSLEDDRGAAFELRRDALHLCASGERRRRPRNVLRVVGKDDLRTVLDDAEGGVAQPAARDAPLDLGDRQQVEKAPLLVARDEEGFPFPELTEEALGLDG